jgi:hypothetical protein
MRADSGSGNRSLGDGFRLLAQDGSSRHGALPQEASRRRSSRRGSGGLQPGEALIVGGFSPRGSHPYRGSKKRSTARAAAPLAVPVALGVTLGVILAVSAGPTKEHVTQGTSGSTNSSTQAPATPSGPATTKAPAGR